MTHSVESKTPFGFLRRLLAKHFVTRPRRVVWAKWLGWKYRTSVGWTPHTNVRGERVAGGIVSFGLGFVEWF